MQSLLILVALIVLASPAWAQVPIPELAAWQSNMTTYGAINCTKGSTPNVTIASSTNASPIQITTASAHGFSNGASLYVYGHQTNTAANSTCGVGERCNAWIITLVDATRFTLNGSTGNGIGGATGSVLTNSGASFLDTYYDAPKVFHNIAAYTGNTATWYPCVDSANVIRRDLYYANNSSTPNAIPGYEHFEEGLATDYLVRGATASRTQAIALSQNAAFALDGTALSGTVSANRMREVAYAVISYVEAERLGQAQRVPRYNDLLSQILDTGGHVDQTANGTSLIVHDAAATVNSHTDGASTAASTTFTSATAQFAATDVGASILVTSSGTGTCVNGLYQITVFTNTTTVTLASSPCSVSATGIAFTSPGVGVRTDGASTAASTTLTAAGGGFDASHVGAFIQITNQGTGTCALGADGLFQIVSVTNPTTIVLSSSPCSVSATGMAFNYPWVYGYKPFMVGIMLHALINAYEWRLDARIPPDVKTMLDYLWTNAWFANECSAGVGAFRYLKTYNGLLDLGVAQGGSCTADLNLLIAPAFAWYYKYSGDTTYRDRGNTVFQEGVQYTSTLNSGKQFDQNYLWSPKYVEWYNQASTPSSTVPGRAVLKHIFTRRRR
jgi:hypothetical protein